MGSPSQTGCLFTLFAGPVCQGCPALNSSHGMTRLFAMLAAAFVVLWCVMAAAASASSLDPILFRTHDHCIGVFKTQVPILLKTTLFYCTCVKPHRPRFGALASASASASTSATSVSLAATTTDAPTPAFAFNLGINAIEYLKDEALNTLLPKLQNLALPDVSGNPKVRQVAV